MKAVGGRCAFAEVSARLGPEDFDSDEDSVLGVSSYASSASPPPTGLDSSLFDGVATSTSFAALPETIIVGTLLEEVAALVGPALPGESIV